jgi:hypothetical protein
MAGAPPTDSPLSVEELRAKLQASDAKLAAAKLAYMRRMPFNGKEVSYEDLSGIAKEYIQASYALQKATMGSVKVRMSIAKLLR